MSISTNLGLPSPQRLKIGVHSNPSRGVPKNQTAVPQFGNLGDVGAHWALFGVIATTLISLGWLIHQVGKLNTPVAIKHDEKDVVKAEKLLQQGKGPQAVELLAMAAAVGNADAFYMLGEVFRYGANGVEKDLPKATRYYELAGTVDHSYVEAHVMAADLHKEAGNKVEAAAWYAIAAHTRKDTPLKTRGEVGANHLRHHLSVDEIVAVNDQLETWVNEVKKIEPRMLRMKAVPHKLDASALRYSAWRKP